jgi:hypothetical protein
MKNYIFKYSFFTFLAALLLCTAIVNAQETDASNYKMLFKFKTIKQADNSRLLEVSFIGQNKEDRKDKLPIFDAEINFFNVANEEEILLGTSKTSEEGTAQITLPENQKYKLDEGGYINLVARFDGTDGIDSQEEMLMVKDLILEMRLEEIDSVKTAFVKAFTIDSLGVETALEEAEIRFFVKGMISKMKIHDGEIYSGEYEFEFPTDLPGDEDGDLIVVASIEDHEEFGNVFQEQTIKWGTHVKMPVSEVKNTLWSEAAPLWMYIVLTILLVGVWANYLYTIINLFKIKKEGVELEPTTEE